MKNAHTILSGWHVVTKVERRSPRRESGMLAKLNSMTGQETQDARAFLSPINHPERTKYLPKLRIVGLEYHDSKHKRRELSSLFPQRQQRWRLWVEAESNFIKPLIMARAIKMCRKHEAILRPKDGTTGPETESDCIRASANDQSCSNGRCNRAMRKRIFTESFFYFFEP